MSRHKDSVKKDKSLLATGIVIAVIVASLLFAYFQINANLRQRSLSRMEEGANNAIEEIISKIERDSNILNATAGIIAQADKPDIDSVLAIMKTTNPLLETMNVSVLLRDNSVLSYNGTITKAEDSGISFEAEAALGEHISNRIYDSATGRPILRHYVPIVRDGKTVAMLYGVSDLECLPENLNIDSIFNSRAFVYIIDTRTGDFIVDTCHDKLVNVADFSSANNGRETKGEKSWAECREDLANMKTGYVIYRTPNTDGWEYMYYAPIGVNQWSIAVDVPEKVAFASAFAVQRICILLGVMLALTVVIYYLWVRRNSKRATDRAVEHAVLAEKLQKAEAADRAKSIFLSNMSHDIRTPMNAIIGYTTLAQVNIDSRERTQEYLQKIMSSSNHMLSLINDVLDMSCIESGKLNIEEKECSISDIFRDLRNIVQTQIQSKQLNFYMDTVDVVDENIYCDKLHVNQVLLNLLSNAIKFTNSGGTVALTVKQKPNSPEGYGSYEFRVKDTGIGMSREFAEHIFEPFERERNTTASGIQGTGLGMAITKNIIDAMGGTIELNTEKDKGTEFIVNLDFRLCDEPKKVEIVKELQGMRALVVDDSFSTCDSVTKMLCTIGMRSEWVMHGKEAVMHAKQAYEMGDEYHAYIIDWYIPDLGGIEVVRRIRSIVGDSAPIIIATAYDWTAFEEEARSAGVSAFCNKPIFLSELCDLLITATGNSLNSQPEESAPNLSYHLRGTRLLLTEDNELNREIAVEILTDSGFIVETAEDGCVAVEKVKNAEPGYYSLILMDIQMPKMNGYDATRAIRALDDPERAGIPIVAMTANAFEEDRKKAFDSGMNAHVSKPIDVEKLLETLTAILSSDGK